VALSLAQEELAERGDIFTHDALAWALAAAGRIDEAQAHMARALAHTTQDARLYFHATVIAAQAGRVDEASEWLSKASSLQPLLLPSEVKQLQAAGALIHNPAPSRIPAASAPSSQSFPAVARESTGTEN
jgi:tetratricopeptide (TPR) repeat protein